MIQGFILIWWMAYSSHSREFATASAGPYSTLEACRTAGQKIEASFKKAQSDNWNFRSTVWWDCTPNK
jgi:hypothetical protein